MKNIYYIKLENDNYTKVYFAKNFDDAILQFLNENPAYTGISQLLENHNTLCLWIRKENEQAKRIEIDIDYNINIRGL